MNDTLKESSKNISFIVTCYNEEKNVVGAIEKVHSAAKQLNLGHEIIVFDDASKDKTAQVVQEYIKNHPEVPVFLQQNKINRGVAYNFVEGAFIGKCNYCRLICGDDIEPIHTHIEILKQMGKADLIIPYYKKIVGRTWFRHLISFSFTKLVNFISGYSLKYYNGCPIIKRYDLMRWHVEATGLGYQAEFITRLLRQGRNYYEIAVDGYDREGSVSLRIRNIVSVTHSIIKIFLQRLRVSVLH